MGRARIFMMRALLFFYFYYKIFAKKFGTLVSFSYICPKYTFL